MSTTNPPTQHIYRGLGVRELRNPSCEPVDPSAIKIPTIADSVPVTWIMTVDVICAREDLSVDMLLELVVRQRIGCVPVVDADGTPIGMITKLDLVEQVRASRDPAGPRPALVASQLMLPLALTLDEHATVAHAAALMAVEDVHHVPIVAESGSLIGVVSSMDVVRWLAANDGYLAQ